MSKGRELSDYLADIHNAIVEVDEFINGMTFDTFEEDRKTINAVIRSLEVLGEATKHIPASFRNKHPEIPWSKMAGMRDVLIHDYMGVTALEKKFKRVAVTELEAGEQKIVDNKKVGDKWGYFFCLKPFKIRATVDNVPEKNGLRYFTLVHLNKTTLQSLGLIIFQR